MGAANASFVGVDVVAKNNSGSAIRIKASMIAVVVLAEHFDDYYFQL
jgi:hypothetical protein